MKLSLAGTVLLCAVCAALSLSTRLAADEPKKPMEMKASALKRWKRSNKPVQMIASMAGAATSCGKRASAAW